MSIKEQYIDLLQENARLIRENTLPEDNAMVNILLRRIAVWRSDSDGIAAYQALALLIAKYREQKS